MRGFIVDLDLFEKVYTDKLFVVGHKYSKLEQVSALIEKMGIERASISKNERLEIIEINKTILKSKKKNKPISQQLKIAKVWDTLALDLFLGNIDKDFWFFEDSNAVNLLDYWKSLDEQLGFVLVYNNPKSMLMNFINLKEKISPKKLDKLLNGWMEYNTTLLNFFYKNQDKSFLVNSNQLKKNNIESIEELTKKIGFEVDAEQITQALCSVEVQKEISKEKSSLVEFLGEALLYEYPAVASLYEEMQSVANIFDRDHNTYKKVDIKDAFCEVVKLEKQQEKFELDSIAFNVEQEKLLQSLKTKEMQEREKREENELLLTQLHQVQEELEKYYLENSSVKKELTEKEKALKEQKQSLETKLSGLQKSSKEEQEKLRQSLKIKEMQEREKREENELLLTQLHQVQEELEKYYLQNKALKEKEAEKKRYYGAAQRVKEQLSYRLGATMIEKSKSFSGVIGLPFTLVGVVSQYKKDLKEKKKKKLPPIERYADAYDAQRVKEHLSYMLGETMIKTMKNPFGIFVLPFQLRATYKTFKDKKSQR